MFSCQKLHWCYKFSMFLHDNVYNKNISKMVQIGDETTH